MKHTRDRGKTKPKELSAKDIAVIKTLHTQYKKVRVKELYKRTFDELVEDFIIECDAKNQAYYFILESGLLDSFTNYCKTNRIVP